MAKCLAFILLLSYSWKLTAAQSHAVTYVYYVAISSQQCSSSFLWWNNCNTVYQAEPRTGILRCEMGWSSIATGCNTFDPCAAGSSGCQQYCDYGGRNASYICSCSSAYSLSSDGHSCNDIDECSAGTDNCQTANNFVCQNTIGGFQCVCRSGFTQSNTQCIDVNECAAQTDSCSTMANYVCQNTVGSYQCVCQSGFTLSNQQCIDIDECAAHTDSCYTIANSTCQNTFGSYQCVCQPGFILSNQQNCTDIDECDLSVDNCTLYENLTCDNTFGSYKCNCPHGFVNLDQYHCHQSPAALASGWNSLSSGIQAAIIAVSAIVGVLLLVLAAVLIGRRLRNKQKQTTITANGSGTNDHSTATADSAAANIRDKSKPESKGNSYVIPCKFRGLKMTNNDGHGKDLRKADSGLYSELGARDLNIENVYQRITMMQKEHEETDIDAADENLYETCRSTA